MQSKNTDIKTNIKTFLNSRHRHVISPSEVSGFLTNTIQKLVFIPSDTRKSKAVEENGKKQ